MNDERLDEIEARAERAEPWLRGEDERNEATEIIKQDIPDLIAEVRRRAERIAELEAALKPFAEPGREIGDREGHCVLYHYANDADSAAHKWSYGIHIKRSDLRRAAELVKESREANDADA